MKSVSSHTVATSQKIELPPYETIALVLQGGGALGAYQAGVYEGLQEAGIEPDCLSGISIGALNTAIIAGNPPSERVEKLRLFWETICQPYFGLTMPYVMQDTLFQINDAAREAVGAFNANNAVLQGQAGFFRPRFPPPPQFTPGLPEAASYYDTSALRDTLHKLCDFERINSGEMRISVGAVNLSSGNFVYFDNSKIPLRAEHFMASGALPPAFAPVEIDGQYYWDGGLVSNTPLAYVLEQSPRKDTLAFQVDLWSARGQVPTNMSEVSDRINDVRYSSRTRNVTEQMRRLQYMRHIISSLLDQIPEQERNKVLSCRLAQELASTKRYNVIHLIYRNQPYEQHYKDHQFGPITMREHWQSGLDDIRNTLQHADKLAMPDNLTGFSTYDVHRAELEQLITSK